MPAKKPWLPELGQPVAYRFAPAFAFSSFSPEPEDAWARDVARPFEIVIGPGYRRPETIDAGWRDAIWYEGSVEATIPVWDGFCPVVLHEVIRECFDPDGPSAAIWVRDVRTGARIEDARAACVLASRPRRVRGETHADHWRRVCRWARDAGCMRTALIHSVPVAIEDLSDFWRRESFWRKLGMTEERRREAAARMIPRDLRLRFGCEPRALA